jgi:2-polyprenyl-3-methyl-5-hydroxy-6-metoxy-1,4-benzoquinol methylase
LVVGAPDAKIFASGELSRRARADRSPATAGGRAYILRTMTEHALSDLDAASEVPERFDPSSMRGELLEAEHLARYRWAASFAPGCRVLDAGCGTAYGAVILAAAGASEVVGVDVATDVLDTARPQVPENVTLEPGDVTALPYGDGRFDLIVCFEVIEHLPQPNRALDEFRRLLSSDGLVAVSSPNRDVYPPGNPHHVHEYTPSELEVELSSRFAFTSLLRQHTWVTSGVLDDEQFARDGDTPLDADVRVRKLSTDRPGAELYTIALAGHRQLPEVPATLELTSAIELRKWDALWDEQSQQLERQAELLAAHDAVFAERATVGTQLHREIDQLRGQLARTEAQLARMPELDEQLSELLQANDQLLAHNHELQLRQQHLHDLEAIAARYTVLVESSSWRLTAPLRRLFALARRLAS